MARVVDLGVVVLDRADQCVLAQARHKSQRLTLGEVLVAGHPARGARDGREGVVQRESGRDIRPFPAAMGERVDELDRTNEVRREALQQQATFLERLTDKPEVEHLQVAQAAVDQLARAARRARGPVTGLEDPDRQTTGHGVQGSSRADHPTAHDDEVELVLLHRRQSPGTVLR